MANQYAINVYSVIDRHLVYQTGSFKEWDDVMGLVDYCKEQYPDCEIIVDRRYIEVGEWCEHKRFLPPEVEVVPLTIEDRLDKLEAAVQELYSK